MLEGIRTPDPRLRRPLLYPAELRTHLSHLHYNRLHIFIRNLLYIMLSIIICKWKAGDGNRTHVSSLEGWCSTIELHPQRNMRGLGCQSGFLRPSVFNAQSRNRTSDTRIFSPLLYQLSYLGLYTIYLCKLREQDLNLRPSGYEPDELPDCSIPRYEINYLY